MQLVQAFVNSVWKCAPISFARLPHCNLQPRVVEVHTNSNQALHARQTKVAQFACGRELGLLVIENWKKMATDRMSLKHLTDISKPNG